MNLLSSDFAESFAKACLFDAVNRWRLLPQGNFEEVAENASIDVVEGIS